MTTETVQSATVSNETLLRDIELTKKEAAAYNKLASGHKDLSELPENQESGQANLHHLKSIDYSHKERACREFLLKLQELKKERGI